MILLIVLVYLMICLSEIIPLYKNKQIKELWMYCITIGIAFFITLLLAFEVNLPKPAEYIENALTPFVVK